MSDYAVVGATGTVGRLIVSELRASGAAVRMLSRHSSEHPVDLTTGRGLSEALSGCGVVIDASNGSPRQPEPVIVERSRRLGRPLGAGALTCPDPDFHCETSFEAWLTAHSRAP